MAVDIHITTAVTDSGRETYYACELTNVVVTDYEISCQGDKPAESFRLAFHKVCFAYVFWNERGLITDRPAHGWNVKKRKPVSFDQKPQHRER